MSFVDQQGRRSPGSVAAVVLVHAAIGYALYAGLAVRFVHRPPVITEGYEVPDTPPPPERDVTPPPARTTGRPVTRDVTTADPIVRTPTADFPPVRSVPPEIDVGPVGETGPVAPLPPTIGADHARAAETVGDRARWVTDADYPPSALRAGVEGTVGITVTIGANGRVAACMVTQGSGNAALDDATCRTYTRRARFRPALDGSGRPTIAQRADRVRWQVPRD